MGLIEAKHASTNVLLCPHQMVPSIVVTGNRPMVFSRSEQMVILVIVCEEPFAMLLARANEVVPGIVVEAGQSMLFRTAKMSTVSTKLVKTIVNVTSKEMMGVEEDSHGGYGTSAAISGSRSRVLNCSVNIGYRAHSSPILFALSRR